MNIFKSLALVAALAVAGQSSAASIFVEAEGFDNKGGWVVDQQFMDQMGSPYLLAHGMGVKVADASTTVDFEESGEYNIFVRTFNWTSPWYNGAGPGIFKLSLDGKQLRTTLGNVGDEWLWQKMGKMAIKEGKRTLALNDLTGFDGRCDAIYFTTDDTDYPPKDVDALRTFRRSKLGIACMPTDVQEFDLVITGGGIAGMCAAVSAARNGLQVALIQDRPVMGGNNSTEVRVHLGGRIEVGPYKNLGNILKEFGQTRNGNAQPADVYEDDKKVDIIANEKNITLFLNNRVNRVVMNGDQIEAVISADIESGKETMYKAPLFVDCTGDGTVGALAGADFRMGRESRYEYNETAQYDMSVGYGPGIKGTKELGSYIAPEKADKMTMGASIQWYSEERDEVSKFPKFNYGVEINADNEEVVEYGEWTWETGMDRDQIIEAERIRDYGMMVVYSNWSHIKNVSSKKSEFAKRELEWVAYVAGKRESRRLLGDYILTGPDIIDYNVYHDGTAATTWSVDLHYPNPENIEEFPTGAFKSIAKHVHVYEYPIPYRCLYSRNVNNLFMAGRNISVTHVALGTVRVMRTTGMMGEVVGMAAAICKEHGVLPRRVYQAHLSELIEMMKVGAGKQGLPNNQTLTGGGHLKEPPMGKKAAVAK